jgi:glycosyltransferase involved in cell wall biosynthesis
MYQLIRGLAQRHEVEVIALTEDSDSSDASRHALEADGIRLWTVPHDGSMARAAFRAISTSRSLYAARYASPAFRTVLRDRLRQRSFDIVQCEFAYMAQYVERHVGPMWVLDEHNVEFQISRTLSQREPSALYRLYAKRELPLRRREELTACQRVDMVLTVSDVDRRALQDELPNLPVSVVPNGVDPEWFRPPVTRTPSAPEMIFVGKLDYRPNVDGLQWFCREVLPLVRASEPAFRLRIIGGGRADGLRSLAAEPGVDLTGFVPDTRPHLLQAAGLIVPLRSGSGTRLKVLEALALGCAVVSTGQGCEGIGVADGVDVLLADTAHDFAAQILRLLRSPDLRSSLGRAGRSLVEREYAWSDIVGRLERVYKRLIESRAPVPAGAMAQ